MIYFPEKFESLFSSKVYKILQFSIHIESPFDIEETAKIWLSIIWEKLGANFSERIKFKMVISYRQVL